MKPMENADEIPESPARSVSQSVTWNRTGSSASVSPDPVGGSLFVGSEGTKGLDPLEHSANPPLTDMSLNHPWRRLT